jgi:hypothetical protein
MNTLPSTSPSQGCIPHTCVHCQKDIIEPTTEELWHGSGFETRYKFQTDGEGALEAAAGGCAFWQWYVRDFLDSEGRMANPMYVPSQCSFDLSFAYPVASDSPLLLKDVYLSRHAEYEDGSMSGGHGIFQVTADQSMFIIGSMRGSSDVLERRPCHQICQVQTQNCRRRIR